MKLQKNGESFPEDEEVTNINDWGYDIITKYEEGFHSITWNQMAQNDFGTAEPELGPTVTSSELDSQHCLLRPSIEEPLGPGLRQEIKRKAPYL